MSPSLIRLIELKPSFLVYIALLIFMSVASSVVANPKGELSDSMMPYYALPINLAADSVNALPNTEVVVPIRVSQFSSIITAQGTIKFNPAVATFIGVEQFGLPGMSSSNFGATQTSSGKLSFSWDDATLKGQTLIDKSILFVIRFKVVGAMGTSSPIDFIQAPTLMEFVNSSFVTVPYSLQSGKIQIPNYSIVTSSIAPLTYCAGSSISVPFTIVGTFNTSNIYTAQLSNNTGGFASPVVIGTGKTSPITAIIPITVTQGTGYRIRVVSSNPAIVGANNGANITINALPTVIAGTNQIVCSNAAAFSLTGFSPVGGTWSGNGIGSSGLFTPSSSLVGTQTLTYTFVQNGCTASATKIITVTGLPNAPLATASATQTGGTLKLNASTIAGATYRWTGPNSFTSTNQHPSLTNASTVMSGVYSVTATANGCTSLAATVNVMIVDVPPVTFALDSVSGAVNTEIVVHVRVKGFNDIISLQYSINWDPTIVSFVSVEQFGLAGLSTSNVGNSQASNGKLTLSWSDAGLQSRTLLDNTTLFGIRFKLVGAKGQISAVNVTASPVPMEVVNGSLFTVPVKTVTGAAIIRNLVKLSGTIHSEHNTPIRSVTLAASDGTSNSTFTTLTDGQFAFDAMQNGNFSIKASKSNDSIVNNGITTLDIALIRRHILNIAALSSAYKLLASDVDRTGQITTGDIAFIRKIVLAIDKYFPGGRQWLFVPSNYQFSTPANPFPFSDTTRSYTKLAGSLTSQDFIGLKLGDVNNTWDSHIARIEAGEEVNFNPGNQVASPSDEIVIPVKVANFKNVSGYQFTLNWNPKVVEFIGVDNQALQGAFGTHRTAEGKMTTTWDDPSGASQTLTDSTIAFAVRFRVIGEPGQQSPVTINSSLTQRIAYNHSLEELTVVSNAGRILVRDDQIVSYQLYQNQPNPFSDRTIIRFGLPTEQPITLTIYNSLGQVIRTFAGTYTAGIHSVEWNGTQETGGKLSGGTYYYQLQAGAFQDVKRLIIF